MKWKIMNRRLMLLINCVSLIMLIISVLALLDIHQQLEPNLDLEWNVLRISFVWFLISIVINIYFAMKISKK